MIADLDDASSTPRPHYDVCIVGSGPAGTTLACELANSGLAIAVLESGLLAPTPHADRLRRVESDGIRIKNYSRERVLGGASTTWAGLSSPLDEIDFSNRPYLRFSGWPIARAEFARYYEHAAQRYRFPRLDAFTANGFGALRARGDLQPAWRALDEKIFLACSEPQNFGVEQRALYESERVDLWLDATVLRLETEHGAPHARRAIVKTRGGREVTIEANAFVLATGGIENARLLLNSRDLCAAGLGNDRDQVGRYLMNHPKNYHGILHLDRPVTDAPYFFGCLHHGFAGYAGLRLPEQVQRERALLNSYVRLEPLFPWSDNLGVEALVLMAKKSRVLSKRVKGRQEKEVVALRDYSETGDDNDLQNERKLPSDWLRLGFEVVKNTPSVASYLHSRLVRRAKPSVSRVRLRNFLEMEPLPENRVTLSDELDAYGQRIPLVRHRPSERDRRSLVALHAALALEFKNAGVGRLESSLERTDPWPIDQDASHHMGTTRMGNDAATSVVDPNGRVHGVDNVFAAGASVFPTSGCANPTFTIVALSIRLAEHLRTRVFVKEPAR
jgi:choline dehydrogenase-like flavoprotein